VGLHPSQLKIGLIMGILSSLFGCTKNNVKTLSPDIDLKLFAIDNSILNEPVSPMDSFYTFFKKHDILNLPKCGIEIGIREDRLDYVFITISLFKGCFLFNGTELKITEDNTPDDIKKIFGEPYWIDALDNEVILFYEYEDGSIELQFEFSDSMHLSHITFMMNGVLSDKKQRESYKITKQWPPDGQPDNKPYNFAGK
jgi:hypothetical protein